MRTICIAVLGALAITACAHAPEPVAGPPSYAAVAVESSPKARFYADCIGQAATGGTYGRAHDEDTEMVLFTCTGAPARAFYDALAGRSAEVGSETQSGSRTYRSTNAVQRDLFGVDYCFTDAGEHSCVVSLNAGEFLRP